MSSNLSQEDATVSSTRTYFGRHLTLGTRKELLSHIQILKEILPFYYESLDETLKKRLEKSFRENRSTYLFRSNPFEAFNDRTLISILEKAVVEKRKMHLWYKQKDMGEIKPLKIIYMEGNLYLAAMTEEKTLNNGFKFLRLSNIDKERSSLLSGTFNETDEIVQA